MDFLGGGKSNEMAQGSNEWNEWRSKHIGASDVPAIMGTCDFKNIYQMWLTKTGQLPKFEGNWATRRGHEMEPKARALYCKLNDCTVTTPTLEYPEWSILSSSLDGWRDTEKIVVEIKTPSKVKHQLALSGIVPDCYKDQIQAQLLVSGGELAHYISYSDEEPEDTAIATVVVYPDRERQREILEAAKKFWQCVQSGTPPEGIADQPELEDLCKKYKDRQRAIKTLEEESESIKDELKKLIKADTVKAGEFKISWTQRKGSVEYCVIPELSGVDLEKYRKPSTRSFNIK